MVRFKVVKASHLLLGISIAVLLAVVVFIGFQLASQQNQSVNSGAKVEETFVSAVSNEIKIRAIPDSTPSPMPPSKTILIYHTHSHEAYEQVEEDPYEAIETWRTEDREHSVVRVGALLAQELRNLGFNVVHDITDHELDDLNNAYVRSLETLEAYHEKFDLYIDLHRDAYMSGMLPCVKADQEFAQLMLLVGRGDNHPVENRPEYESNLRFAQELTSILNGIQEGICRNVTVKTGRYNQHIGTPSILIEFGHNKNTLQQALNTVPIAAKGIAEALRVK